ncbi:MAG: prolyl-tRNA synthetase associated domain-containing protein, partial [Oscillospiraceae bacterium]|nr:prolyl-tRNA synthetase associated domain-containing protein [Oscillospiraceae bacterium]
EKLEHEAVYTMEDMEKAGIVGKGTVCKNLFLRDAKGKTHYLVTIPEEKRVDMKSLAENIGSTKLSFASAERLTKYLGVEQGCVSPFGVLNDESQAVIVVFDNDLQNDKAVGIHPNDNTATVWLAFSDLHKIIKEHGNEICFADFNRS